ncbi:hypothetical protein BDZ89DRAFT_1004501 [Hymenopellis radicata]|nr:hypothetical protein BDZ89DRAFT_1004501 [Hymenopellis radicata]
MQSFLLLALFCRLSFGRLLHSLPEDTYAFPKYKVSFLSHLPLRNETAQKWLHDGLRGGQLEFLDQPFQSHREIASSDADELVTEPIPHSYSLEQMKMGPNDSYLCLIPKPLDPPASSAPEAEAELEVSPAHSWSLLEPLTGSCLYVRCWFTYSYCHNAEIRQFKERINPHGTAPGAKIQKRVLSPTMTPPSNPSHLQYESYTLGKAPQTSTDIAVREGSIELAHGGGGSRYLVQTWGDGTLCDKSGKPREVQVQFHCSMAMSDTILFVKEAKTCSYVLVINTPRLCSEPGFKSTRDVTEQAYIQCREVVSDGQLTETGIDGKEAQDFPRKLVRPKAELPPPAKDSGKTGAPGNNQQVDDILKKAMNMLLGSGQGVEGAHLANGKLVLSDDGAVMVEFVEDLPLEDLLEDEELGDDNGVLMDRLVDILKSAGINVKDAEEEAEDSRPLDEL